MKLTKLLFLVLAALPAIPGESPAQSTAGTIQGVVRSEAGPIEAATVTIVGTNLGAVTRADGRYTISNVPAGTQTVRAMRIGFGRREQSVLVPANQTATANFDLRTAAVELEQVVVTGYGTSARRDVTGSISSVTTDQIATMPLPRVDQAISGLVSGVQVQTTNAQPGSEMRIRIRGGNSLQGSNEPLVVVDGVIGADLNQISPNDVEAVDILKDASATAIYGARGANGVILVTTKRGAPGSVRFEYSGYTGMQNVSKKIDLLSADEFALMYMRNPNHDKSITYDTTKTGLPTTDWQDEVYRAAPIRNNEVRVSGSNGGTALLASATLYQQEGIVLNSSFDRGSLRFNLDQAFGRRVKGGTRVSYSRSVGNEVRVNDGYGSAGGPVTMMALRFAPTIPVYALDGTYSPPLLPAQTFDNPLAIVNLLDNKTTTNYLLGNLFANLELSKGLDFRTSLSYTSSSGVQQRYTSRLLRAALGSGQANVDNNLRTTLLAENTLTARRSMGRSDFTVLGGFTAQEAVRNASNAQGVGFTSDLLGYRRLNLAETVTAGSSSSRDRLLSYLGRLNYGYAGKYLLTTTFRADGASKFAENNKWAYFPSFALAWRVSDEAFMKRIPVVSEFKIRGSSGRTGSEAISAYQSLAAWSVGAPYVIGTTRLNNGANPSRNSNPNLKWETSEQKDLGFDLGLLENRVSLTFDAYKKTTKDLLYSKQVPYYTGYTDYVTNIGSVENKGMEFGLDTRHNIRSFDVRLGGNLSFNRSKVLDLGGDKEYFLDGVNGSLPTFRPAAIVRVGEPLGNFYGYIWDGIFQNAAEVTASKQAGAQIGGMKLRDINGRDAQGNLTGVPDGQITTDDRTILGNAQPKYTFGQNGFIGWRSFSVNYLLRGVQGVKVVNLNRQGMSTPGSDVNTLRATLNYWSPTNPTNDMTGMGIGPFNQMTDRWVEDGSFVRLQNMTLSWDVPQRLTTRASMSNLRLYLSGQNLKTWTKYSWYDPEASSRGTRDLELGWDDSSYPGVRTFTLGATVGF